MEKRISPLYWLVIALAFCATWVLPGIERKDEQRFLAPPPEHMELFHFGFADSMADSLWLRWIQDNDYCQTYKGAGPASPIPEQTGDFANPRHRYCDNSWSFKMLDSVTKIAPRFRMPYAVGALLLSVMVEDYEGAKVIFDRAVETFPNDWDILYMASYHYLFDRHELPKAAELLERAAKAGGPGWLPLLASRLYSKSGQIEIGIKTLERYRENLKDEKDIKVIDERIAALKAQLNQ
jgi:hypothetical protein